MPEQLSVADLGSTGELYTILIQHAYRGIRVQFLLRLVLVVFMAVAIAAVPPAHARGWCFVIVGAYIAGAAGVAIWTIRGGPVPVRWMWVALVADVIALTALTLVAGASAEQSWTADLLVNGYFLIPMLAATELRPLISTAVAVPAVAAYFGVSVVTKAANTEPWGSILTRTMVLVGLGVGCVVLSRVQLSRVLTIARLARDRSELLAELLGIETRERNALAEQLHDGALQYVLAARLDLEDARESSDPLAFERVQHALTTSSQLLRSTVSQLHPAVLDQVGLARALSDLAADVAARGGLQLELNVAGWSQPPDASDGLLYSCARELLTNVLKHAQARTVRVELGEVVDAAALTITDDGCGVAAGSPAARLAEGHIGLASLRARVAAGGGELSVGPGSEGGTRVRVSLPFS